jgi:hypothetical protein
VFHPYNFKRFKNRKNLIPSKFAWHCVPFVSIGAKSDFSDINVKTGFIVCRYTLFLKRKGAK